MAANKLTDKQERFVLALVAGMTQRQAYKEAYNAKNMSDKTIDEKASVLFKDGGKVRARYNELHDRLIREAEREAIMDGIEVLSELSKVGRAKVTDYLNYRTIMRQVDVHADGTPIYDWAMVVDALDSTEVDGSPIQEVSIAKDGTFKFKLYNKLDALEKLARHLGLYGDSEADKDALAKLDKLIEGIDGAAKR